MYQRFRDWRDDGTFDRVLERFHIRLNQEGLIDLDIWMIESTAVRAGTLQAPEKRVPEEPPDHALGLSLGGLTTKIQMICDTNSVPLRFILPSGQAGDIADAQPLLDQVRTPGKPGRPYKRSRWLLADKSYDAQHLRHYCDRCRILGAGTNVVSNRLILREDIHTFFDLCLLWIDPATLKVGMIEELKDSEYWPLNNKPELLPKAKDNQLSNKALTAHWKARKMS